MRDVCAYLAAITRSQMKGETMTTYTTEGAREENERWTEKDERMHGPNQNIETYFDDGKENEIECTNSEREDFERDSGMELTGDTLNAQTFCLFRDFLRENYELKTDAEVLPVSPVNGSIECPHCHTGINIEPDQGPTREEMRHELEARRADALQLERMARMINEATPNFRSVMGSECDHAEIALAAMIRRLKAADSLADQVLALYDVPEIGLGMLATLKAKATETKGAQ